MQPLKTRLLASSVMPIMIRVGVASMTMVALPTALLAACAPKVRVRPTPARRKIHVLRKIHVQPRTRVLPRILAPPKALVHPVTLALPKILVRLVIPAQPSPLQLKNVPFPV